MSDLSARKYSRLSNHEKQKYLKEYLGKDFHLMGKNLVVLDKTIEYIGKSSDTLTVVELLPRIGPWLGRFAIVSAAAEGLTIASIVLFPVGTMISIINALQSAQRMYGMRAVAYTTTAFAFDDPIPAGSPTIIDNRFKGPYVAKDYAVSEEQKAWRKASNATRQRLLDEITKRQGSKKDLQMILQALGDGNRQQLCLALLKGFESDHEPVVRNIWKSGYKIKYPN